MKERMKLRDYQTKRDFGRTSEPPPRRPKKPRSGSHFVVQKHDASRLHYDFRLEMEGVLKSWAIPKGIPFGKGERHLAVQVEDHPLDYAAFEGVIPEGEYGGGTVMLWDAGTYEVLGEEALRALQQGKLHMILKGKKLRGEWTLVRTRSSDGKEQWLLLKTGASVTPVSAHQDDRSVTSKRTMRQIAGQKTEIWIAKKERSEARQSAKSRKTPAKNTSPHSAKVPAGRGPALEFIEPMKARFVESPPTHGDWIYELKWDGYRAIAIKDGDAVEIYSRNRKLLSADFPEVKEAVAGLSADRVIIDGEIVALDPCGRPSFQLLQGRSMATQRPAIFFYAFDLLHLEGKDLRRLKLCERKAKLDELVKGSEVIRYSAALGKDARETLKHITEMGLEGLIGKRRDSVYESGLRTGAWVKVKCVLEQEFVIGGFTKPRGTRSHLGALLVGYYEDGKFHHAGRVGTGFNERLLKMLRGKLDELQTNACPFVETPSKAPSRWARNVPLKEALWVKPQLVCQVKFSEWTDEGLLRQPVFLGLREDKDPREVVRETPAHLT